MYVSLLIYCSGKIAALTPTNLPNPTAPVNDPQCNPLMNSYPISLDLDYSADNFLNHHQTNTLLTATTQVDDIPSLIPILFLMAIVSLLPISFLMFAHLWVLIMYEV